MSIIKILQYPDPRLYRQSIEVLEFNDDLQKVIDDMFETHYATPNCAALAATQLDLPIAWRITVIDYSAEKNQPLCLVNAHIVERYEEQNEFEGCMSVYPDVVHEKIKRALNVKVKAQDRHGNPLEIDAEGYFAKCLQHELDHLDGRLFIDHLSRLKNSRIDAKIKKYHKINKNS